MGSPKLLQCPNCHILQAFCITTTITKCQCHGTWPLLSLKSSTLTTPDQLPWLVFITRPHCQLLPGSPRKEQKQLWGIAFLWQQGKGSAALMSAFEGNTWVYRDREYFFFPGVDSLLLPCLERQSLISTTALLVLALQILCSPWRWDALVGLLYSAFIPWDISSADHWGKSFALALGTICVPLATTLERTGRVSGM